MTKIIILLTLCLTGCATVFAPPVDKQCATVAAYARSVATMKGAGLSITDVNSFTSQPVALTFPLQLLKSEVYNSEFSNPAEAYSYYYEACTTVGYINMLERLKSTEERSFSLIMSPQLSSVPVPTRNFKKDRR